MKTQIKKVLKNPEELNLRQLFSKTSELQVFGFTLAESPQNQLVNAYFQDETSSEPYDSRIFVIQASFCRVFAKFFDLYKISHNVRNFKQIRSIETEDFVTIGRQTSIGSDENPQDFNDLVGIGIFSTDSVISLTPGVVMA